MQVQSPAAPPGEVPPNTAVHQPASNELRNVPYESPVKTTSTRMPNGESDEAMIKGRDLTHETQDSKDASCQFMVTFAVSGSDTDPTTWSFRLRALAM